jgi:hypothetical protein
VAVEERGGEDLDDERREMAATGNNRRKSIFLFIIRQLLFSPV